MKQQPKPKDYAVYKGKPCYILESDSLISVIKQGSETKKVLTSKIHSVKNKVRVAAKV